MPMTGFTVFIREDRLIPLPLSVDEALRVTVSAGVLIPIAEQVSELNASLERLGAEMTAPKKKPKQDSKDEIS